MLRLAYKCFTAFLNNKLLCLQLFLLIQIKASEMYTNNLKVWVNNIFFCDKLSLEHSHLPTQLSQILLPPFCRFAAPLGPLTQVVVRGSCETGCLHPLNWFHPYPWPPPSQVLSLQGFHGLLSSLAPWICFQHKWGGKNLQWADENAKMTKEMKKTHNRTHSRWCWQPSAWPQVDLIWVNSNSAK